MQRHSLEKGEGQALASAYLQERGAETRKRVYNHVLRKLGNRSDAEDITQETLAHAWSGRGSYNASRSFEAWILRIATNLCIDQIRRSRRRPMVSLQTCFGVDADGEENVLEIADWSHNPETLVLADEVDASLLEGMRSLPRMYHVCVALKEKGYSYEEIAGMMHCPVGTVRSRLHRARTHLSRAMSR